MWVGKNLRYAKKHIARHSANSGWYFSWPLLDCSAFIRLNSMHVILAAQLAIFVARLAGRFSPTRAPRY